MPDWFYRTVSRPALFRLPARTASQLTLKAMGALARVPLGSHVIDFLGHMAPPVALRKSFLDINFPTSVGLSSWLDTDALALPALARFGFGFLEIGQIAVEPFGKNFVERRPHDEAICHAARSLGLKVLRPRIEEASRLRLPLLLRLQPSPNAEPEKATSEIACLMRELAPFASLFSVPLLAKNDLESWRSHIRRVVAVANEVSPPRPVLLRVPPSDEANEQIAIALQEGVAGLQLNGALRNGHDELIGAPIRVLVVEKTRQLRAKFPQTFILGAGGVHQPQHALELYQAGADLVALDSGLVFGGPGLPKRINEALLFEAAARQYPAKNAMPKSSINALLADWSSAFASDAQSENRPQSRTWFWTFLMGAGMLFGSVLTLGIALTRVVLPYDEAFLGMSRAQLHALNPRLLPFMMHDRVTLAGTMVALGVLYVGLSFGGVRRGMHWAQKTVFVSAFTGFGSFFFFLGFGYLDTLHAFVTGCLLQFLLLGVHSRLGEAQHDDGVACFHDDRAWKRSLWGQLLMVGHSAALLVAGLAVSGVGVTRVFTPHDLEFIGSSWASLQAANPHLVPLIAHDRATLGGMLLSSGWAFLLPALWGYRRGRAYLWWTFLIAGLCAYGAAIGVHFSVGYISFGHLVPAFAGLVLFLVSLALSHSYLCDTSDEK